MIVVEMALEENKTQSEYCNVCRICLQTEGNKKYRSLFEPFMGFCPAYFINSLTVICICNDDDLPQIICDTCLSDLETVIYFKQKCENSNAFLHQTISEINKDFKPPKTELYGEVAVKEETDFEYLAETQFEDEIFIDEALPKSEKCKIKLQSRERKNKTSVTSSEIITVDFPAKSPVICHDCGVVFQSKCKLRVHWKKVHKPNVYFLCDFCKAKFRCVQTLNKHKALRIRKCETLRNAVSIDGIGKERKFTCLKCDYNTKHEYFIHKHLAFHSGDLKAKCSQCNKWFCNKGSVTKHIENFHKQYKKIITCEVCGIKLYTQEKYYSHMKRKHSNLYYECDLCHKRLKTKHTLRDHLKRHTGLKNYTCEYCAKVVTTSSELSIHIGIVHLNKKYCKKSILCPICNYKTVTKKNMDSHLLKHSGKNFSCDFCGKFYEKELDFWVHKICHLEKDSLERRLCPFCSKLCENSVALKKHMTCHLKKKDILFKKYDIDEVISRIKSKVAGLKPIVRSRKPKTETKIMKLINENDTGV